MALENFEIEFKYVAEISLSEFKEFCESRNPLKFQIISGYDHFLANPGESDSFYRHRVNTNENQLTFKRKKTTENNFMREEHNVDLPLTVSKEKIRNLCNISGYKPASTIFKNCFIYNYDYYTLVFYAVYSEELKELGRFIEIEMKEDHDWASPNEAYSGLVMLEKLCKSIGAAPERRVMKSLYELYGKGAQS